jgi:hypothetical protein
MSETIEQKATKPYPFLSGGAFQGMSIRQGCKVVVLGAWGLKDLMRGR